ncbi:MAG: tRNA pseudouridine(55) synthase TruB [Clostridiales bacterium]|nr:tRNA pseudouridine(55) synthase TruB [Clostridiales bacterium]
MDGILIVNKPKNCTSHDVVYKVKKITNQKVGHTGTLDPMATGVLPLLIGKGTLCSKYLIEHDKIYKATIQLGKKTTTADQEGEVIEEQEIANNALEPQYVTKRLKEFLGKQIQTPPMYSAIKVNGKKLYEYARKGQNVEVPKREIEIYEIELLNIDKQNKKIEYKVHCSKGTYIRSLCEDIAEKLGTIGYMAELERLKVGKFILKNAVSIDDLEKENIEKNIITIEEIFKNNEKINLTRKKLELFLNGVQITYDSPDGVYKIYCENKFIGTGTVKEKLLKRDVII